MPDGAQEAAVTVAEFAVANLRLEPGDVLVVKVPEAYGWAEMNEVRDVVAKDLAEGDHEGVPVLVVPHDCDLTKVTLAQLRALTDDDVRAAGAGSWPHEHADGT